MRSAYLTLKMESNIEAERVFAALSDGGRVFDADRRDFLCLPLWQVQDRFGIKTG